MRHHMIRVQVRTWGVNDDLFGADFFGPLAENFRRRRGAQAKNHVRFQCVTRRGTANDAVEVRDDVSAFDTNTATRASQHGPVQNGGKYRRCSRIRTEHVSTTGVTRNDHSATTYETMREVFDFPIPQEGLRMDLTRPWRFVSARRRHVDNFAQERLSERQIQVDGTRHRTGGAGNDMVGQSPPSLRSVVRCHSRVVEPAHRVAIEGRLVDCLGCPDVASFGRSIGGTHDHRNRAEVRLDNRRMEVSGRGARGAQGDCG